MLQEKEKSFQVELTENNGENKTVNIVVKKPSSTILTAAQRLGAKIWTDCVREGIMTRKELEKFMKEQNIWDDNKDKEQQKIIQEISNLEKKLYVNGNAGKKLKASEGKNIAIEMRIKRNELRDLIAEKMSLEQNTAESISENSKFEYLVSSCTFYENGQKVYSNLEDYQNRADDKLAFMAASNLAAMIYSVDKDFEAKLPENKFLKMFNFVDDDLNLVNKEGETVDLDGKRIDKNGYWLNEDGKRVDKDGNVLDENGNYIPSVEYITDDEEVSLDKPAKRKKSATTDS
jgi:hypothetical protein